MLVAGAGVSYLTQLGTARLVGPDAFGLYMYALSWATVAASFSTLGFHVSLLRLVPACRAREDWAGALGAERFATSAAVAASGLLAGAGAAVTLALGGWRTVEGATLLLALAAAPFLALQLVAAAAVRAYGGVVRALAPERLVRDPAALAALAALALTGAAAPGAPAAMAGMLVSAAIIAVLSLVLRRRLRPPQVARAAPRFALRDWIRPTLPLTAIMAADVSMARSGVILLGLLASAREAGVFAVAMALATLAAMPRMAVAAAFAPTVAELHARGDRAALQALLARAARLSLSGALLVAAGLAAGTPWLLSLFGEGFAQGAPAVAILVAGQLVAAAAGPQQHLMTMTANERAGAWMHAGGALAGLGLCAALAAPFGVVGAAVAATAGVVIWNLAMAWFAQARLGLRPGLLARTRPSQQERFR
ncbi:lipopolysaccharide biosynthesis protein [Albimonas pacifica]|uniref:lipopolysaccharide biosynthesis protein n=1 Tax=Albimonas pacifica TaxID=1114924 RepID=UPI0015A6EF5E|nr:oligosaccharide flippase family protein [Albimonas pacifica]